MQSHSFSAIMASFRRMFIELFILIIITHVCQCQQVGNPRVKVLDGELEGVVATSEEGKQFYSFQGIPYAEPPLGELRFQPPVPKKPWSGVRNATQEGQMCAQLNVFDGIFGGVEDCLFLNVHTPELPQGEDEKPLPVMFYIHGGGFVMGSGGSEWFSPDFIIAKDTILITINYRLGALGFLSLDTPAAPGNAGLRDQNLALKWVQKNIRAFNGDPDNVTIFGISAGSASVDYHLLSPMSKGLFHKAILQSGSALNPWARTRNPKKLVDSLVNSLEITTEDPDQLLKDLLNVDAEKLVTFAFTASDVEDIQNGELYAFVPIVEKTLPEVEAFLNAEPMELLISGQYNQVPTITGFVENEGGLFKTTYGEHTENLMERKFIDYLPSTFDVDRVAFDVRLRETYNQTDDTEAVDAFLSDVCFLGGVTQSLRNRLRQNQTENYIYMFAYDGTINFIKALLQIDSKGAYHSDDSTYLSDSIYISHITPTAQDSLVRSRMVQMWTDFARSGNPTPEQSGLITAEWLPSAPEKLTLLKIQEELSMDEFPFPERMDLWKSLYSTSANNQPLAT